MAIGQSSEVAHTLSLFQGIEIKIEPIFALWAAVPEIQANFQNCHIWAWNLAIGRSARSCTYTFFLPQGVEIELIFALRVMVSEIGADFQNDHISAWNLAIGHSSRSCAYTCTPFLPQRGIIEVIFALQVEVSEIRANFQNCHIWGWNLGIGQGSFYPKGSKLSLVLLYGQRFPRPIFACTGSAFRGMGPIFKIAIFGHETWQLAKVPEVAYILSFYHRGSKLSLLLLYGQWFPRYGPIFQIGIFGHETWPLAKVPDVAHIPSFYPKGSKLSLFSLYGQRFPRYGPIFKIGIFGHKTWLLAKVPENVLILSLCPMGVKIQLIFALWAAVSKTLKNGFWKLPCLGMKLGHWTKRQMLHIYPLSTPQSSRAKNYLSQTIF